VKDGRRRSRDAHLEIYTVSFSSPSARDMELPFLRLISSLIPPGLLEHGGGVDFCAGTF
jgi:hypothetical protein